MEFKDKKPDQEMRNFSIIIYNEVNFITSYCIKKNIDFDSCDYNTLNILSENIGIIFLGAVITCLDHFGLVKEKKELIEDFEIYIKELYGKNKPWEKVLEKVFAMVAILNRNFVPDDEEETIKNWKIWIREIISRPKNKAIGEIAAIFTGRLYDANEITNDLINHIKLAISIIKDYN